MGGRHRFVFTGLHMRFEPGPTTTEAVTGPSRKDGIMEAQGIHLNHAEGIVGTPVVDGARLNHAEGLV